MKIYIVYEKDGYGSSSVDKVFNTEEKAIDFVIKTKLNFNNSLKERSDESLKKEACNYIELFEVE